MLTFSFRRVEPVATALCVIALSCLGSCATTPGVKAPTLQRGTGSQEGAPAISPPELVSLSESLADIYVTSVAEALNSMNIGAAAPDVRKRAQHIKVFVGTTAYSLVTSPNPEIALIDLTVNISVQHAIFKGGLAAKDFGDDGRVLVAAYDNVRGQAWKTLEKIYTASQLDLLRDGIERWLAHRPETAPLQIVRLPALAKYRDVTPLSTPGTVRLMAPVAEAARTAMQLQLLGERSLFLAQRYPYLINWQSEQVLYDGLATPEVRAVLRATETYATTAERLTSLIQEVPDSASLRAAFVDLRGTLTESTALLGSLHGLVREMNQTIAGTDRLLAPFQSVAPRSPAVGGGPQERTFDVGTYTELMKELTKAVSGVNVLVENSRALVNDPQLSSGLRQISAGAERVGNPLDRFVDRVFVRSVALVCVFFTALVAYRAATLWLRRRLS